MYAVIMAGGRGSRFWPRSRKKYSKQTLNIIGKRTMIQDTCRRLRGLIEPADVFVITNKLLEAEIKRQLPQIPPDNIIAEPANRSTAACIGLAAIYLRRLDPEGIMGVFAADHLIRDVQAFQEDMRIAAGIAAENNALVTFGIPPVKPETGFGYVRTGERVEAAGERPVFRVEQFVEKPDMPTAEKFFNDPTYLVNSGMFMWKISTILDEIGKFLPEMREGLERIARAIDTPMEIKALGEIFPTFQSVSIDRAVMEKTSRAVVLPARFDWNDLGSWSSLHDVWPKDENNNACVCRKLAIDTSNTLIWSPNKLVATIGVSDLVIVETEDAILVCHKDRAQDVSRLVDMMRRDKLEEFL